MKRTGIFVGSFDPFTIGHDSVVRRALALFDHLVIGVGVNQNKRYMLSADERVEAIRSLYRDEPRISVEQYSDLTVDFAKPTPLGVELTLRGKVAEISGRKVYVDLEMYAGEVRTATGRVLMIELTPQVAEKK